MKQILFFDTETTDLKEGRLVELAYFGEGMDTPLAIRVKPPVPISFEAMGVHHITEEEVADLPPFSFIEKEVEVIFKNRIVVAHNAPFDIGVMAREGIAIDAHIDTQRISKHLYPEAKEYKLQTLRYYLGVPVALPCIPHTAECDVRVLVAVFEKMKQKVGEIYELDTDEAIIQKMLELTLQPVRIERIPFSFKKHANRLFGDIVLIDPSYIEWMHKSVDPVKEPDLSITVGYWFTQIKK